MRINSAFRFCHSWICCMLSIYNLNHTGKSCSPRSNAEQDLRPETERHGTYVTKSFKIFSRPSWLTATKETHDPMLLSDLSLTYVAAGISLECKGMEEQIKWWSEPFLLGCQCVTDVPPAAAAESGQQAANLSLSSLLVCTVFCLTSHLCQLPATPLPQSPASLPH